MRQCLLMTVVLLLAMPDALARQRGVTADATSTASVAGTADSRAEATPAGVDVTVIESAAIEGADVEGADAESADVESADVDVTVIESEDVESEDVEGEDVDAADVEGEVGGVDIDAPRSGFGQVMSVLTGLLQDAAQREATGRGEGLVLDNPAIEISVTPVEGRTSLLQAPAQRAVARDGRRSLRAQKLAGGTPR